MKRILPLLLASLAAWPAAAQNPEEETSRSAQEELQKRKAAAETAAEASARRPLEGAEVTYEQVLADPDNVELNFRWAKKQVEKGDVKGASATLERILMVRPDLAPVRLTYAVALYRLDNMPEAHRELNRVKEQASGAVLAEAQDYLKRVEARERLTHLTGTLGYGFQYDDNRNAGPSSGQSLFNGTAVNLTSGKATSNTSQLFLAQAGIRRDLQNPLWQAAFADLTYYRAQQTTLDTLNLQAYSFDAGLEMKMGRWTVSPTALFDHIRLHEQTYLRTRGARLRADRRVNNRVAVYGYVQGVFHDYIVTRDIPTATDRTGNETTLVGGAQFTMTATQRLTTEVGYTQQDARRIWDAYNRNAFSVTHAWLVGHGRFVLTGLTYDRDHYQGPDTVIAPQERADDIGRFDWTFGQPMGFLGKAFEPLLFTFTYEYLQANSNILNYAYSNNKVNGMLTYRWGY